LLLADQLPEHGRQDQDGVGRLAARRGEVLHRVIGAEDVRVAVDDVERRPPGHWSELREPGSSRGWPELGGSWLRCSGVREPGSGRGGPGPGGSWLRCSKLREAGVRRGWSDAAWLRSAFIASSYASRTALACSR